MDKIGVYLARSMSNRLKEDVVMEAYRDSIFVDLAGFKALCPVSEEKVQPSKDILQASLDDTIKFWQRDKEMIRESHIVFHMTPHLRSDGAWHEVGYQRYHLQGPVVHIYPPGKLPVKAAISFLEDDYVTDNLVDAMEYTLRVHGTFWKRTKWRLNKLNKCFIKSFMYQLKQWFK